MRRETQAHSDNEKIIQKRAKIPSKREGRCQDCAAQKPHDGTHQGNRERTVRREHLMRRSPDMLTGGSMQACLCREAPPDHEAHGQRSGCRRARAQLQESRRLSFGGLYTLRPKQNSRNTLVFVLRQATGASERRGCGTRALEL